MASFSAVKRTFHMFPGPEDIDVIAISCTASRSCLISWLGGSIDKVTSGALGLAVDSSTATAVPGFVAIADKASSLMVDLC